MVPRRLLRASALAAALAVPVGSAGAQQQEFGPQDLLIPPLGGDLRLGRDIADAARRRVESAADRRLVNVFPGWAIDNALRRAGFGDKAWTEPWLLQWFAQVMRADEYVRGAAERTGNRVIVRANLVLTRDRRLYQPLPTTSGTLDEVAAQLATHILDARRQMTAQRRCENAVRLGDGATALREARKGIAASPRADLLRVCALTALLSMTTEAHTLLAAADSVLATYPENYWALEATAQAYDALKERERAAHAWLRVAATDTANLELAARVGRQLALHDNAEAAEPFIIRASDAHPEDLDLQRVRFDVLYRNTRWPAALTVGQRLFGDDSVSRHDPIFHLRFATTYRRNGQPVGAIEAAARAVQQFPDEPRLLELYAELVREEGPAVVARGLAAFPSSAPLNVMRARDLKAAGKSDEALVASRRAVAVDPSLPHALLQLAQAEFEARQPDSALISLHRAIAAGEDSATVAQFALARGNAMLRAADSAQTPIALDQAFAFLVFADSVRGSVQSRFLLGTAALAALQRAATDAPAERRCDLARRAQSLVPLATEKLTAGAAVAPDAVRQNLQRLDLMSPIIDRQVAVLCSVGSAGTR